MGMVLHSVRLKLDGPMPMAMVHFILITDLSADNKPEGCQFHQRTGSQIIDFWQDLAQVLG